jgi:hypothetical protein
VQETVSRSIGTLQIGGVPTGTPGSVSGPGFNDYFISLTNYADTVTATAGSSAAAPTATITSGTLSYYNGTGYTTVDLATTPSYTFPANWSKSVSWTQASPTRSVTVTMSATGTPGMGTQPSTSSSPSGSGSILRNDVTSSVGSPLAGNFTYTITRCVPGCTTSASVTITLDLGTITGRAVYQPKQAA